MPIAVSIGVVLSGSHSQVLFSFSSALQEDIQQPRRACTAHAGRKTCQSQSALVWFYLAATARFCSLSPLRYRRISSSQEGLVLHTQDVKHAKRSQFMAEEEYLAAACCEAWDGLQSDVRPLLVVQPPDPPNQWHLVPEHTHRNNDARTICVVFRR